MTMRVQSHINFGGHKTANKLVSRAERGLCNGFVLVIDCRGWIVADLNLNSDTYFKECYYDVFPPETDTVATPLPI